MADYAPIPVTSTTWTALPAATEAGILQCQGGAILVTRHSAPTGDNGIRLNDGDAIAFASGDVWRYRLAGNVGATIIRA